MIPKLTKVLSHRGLGGLETLCGIPCTIGGATIKNAGCFGSTIGDLVSKIYCIDPLTLKSIVLRKKDLSYSYRSSGERLKNLVILYVELELTKTNEDLGAKIKEFTRLRRNTQPSAPSLGSVFLRPETNVSAGFLIDKLGLKGTSIGGAQISKTHANFIVNLGDATSKDYLDLIELCRCMVKKKYNVDLKKEIDIVGED